MIWEVPKVDFQVHGKCDSLYRKLGDGFRNFYAEPMKVERILFLNGRAVGWFMVIYLYIETIFYDHFS